MERIRRYLRKLEEKENELQQTGLWQPDELRREQTRGVFVLGILAILVAFREFFLPALVGQSREVEFVPWILGSFVFLWSIYAFSMVIALSEDIFPKVVCLGAKKLGRYSLWPILLTYLYGYILERAPLETRPAIMIFLLGLVAISIYWLRTTLTSSSTSSSS